MDSNQINPYIRKAMLSKLVPGSEIKQRVIFDYELIYIEYGSFTLRYAGVDHACGAGDLLLLRPGIAHSFLDIRAELSQPHIHFDMTWSEDSERVGISFKDYPQLTKAERSMIREDLFKHHPPQPFLTIRDMERFRNRFFQLVSPERESTPLQKKAMMIELLDQIIEDNYPELAAPGQLKDIPVPQLVKEYIDSSYEKPITLESLEKQFFYNRFYLEKQFINLYGMPVISYRNMLRIRRAKELLKEHSVTETAALLGYSSLYAFSRAFKNSCGESPACYQEKTRFI